MGIQNQIQKMANTSDTRQESLLSVTSGNSAQGRQFLCVILAKSPLSHDQANTYSRRSCAHHHRDVWVSVCALYLCSPQQDLLGPVLRIPVHAYIPRGIQR
jgi:hypothetical protein